MGMSPYRVIFNKDPLLPFEFADKQKRHLNVTDSESESNESGTDTGNGIEKEVGSSFRYGSIDGKGPETRRSKK